jgi:hypothetical protein
MINWKGHLKLLKGISGKSFNSEDFLPNQESLLSISIGQAVYASARDITEHLSIQEASRTSEARYRNLVQNSPTVNCRPDK